MNDSNEKKKQMFSKIHKHIAIAPMVVAMILAGQQAQAATLANNGDSWVRESSPGNSFSSDLISVWSSVGGDRRYGVVSFDVGSLADPVTAVSLSVWSQAFGFSDDAVPLIQSAIAIDPTGINADAATWNQVAGAGTLHTFGNLGAYDIPAVGSTPGIQDVFLESVGTPADAAFVESIRTGSGTLMIAMIADESGPSYRNSWGDGEFNGQDAFLSTNADVIPEPGSFALVGLASLMLLRRRR